MLDGQTVSRRVTWTSTCVVQALMVSTAEMSDQMAVTEQSGRKAVSSTTQQLLERASKT